MKKMLGGMWLMQKKPNQPNKQTNKNIFVVYKEVTHPPLYVGWGSTIKAGCVYNVNAAAWNQTFCRSGNQPLNFCFI